LKARANRAKSGSLNFSRRLSRRTAIKKYRSERKGRRSFDTAIEYGTVAMMATEKTRTAKPAVRATCFCRVHQTLRVTPAMEPGITDHVWTIEEMLEKIGL
jgi:hypothetical protein